jgi:hypothetical protein
LSAGDPEVVSIVGDITGIVIGNSGKQPPLTTTVTTTTRFVQVATLHAVKLTLLYSQNDLLLRDGALTTEELLNVSSAVSAYMLQHSDAVPLHHYQNVLFNLEGDDGEAKDEDARRKRRSIYTLEATQVFSYSADAADAAAVAADVVGAVAMGDNTFVALDGQDIIVASVVATTVTLAEASQETQGTVQNSAVINAADDDGLSAGATAGIVVGVMFLIAAVGYGGGTIKKGKAASKIAPRLLESGDVKRTHAVRDSMFDIDDPTNHVMQHQNSWVESGKMVSPPVRSKEVKVRKSDGFSDRAPLPPKGLLPALRHPDSSTNVISGKPRKQRRRRTSNDVSGAPEEQLHGATGLPTPGRSSSTTSLQKMMTAMTVAERPSTQLTTHFSVATPGAAIEESDNGDAGACLPGVAPDSATSDGTVV